MKAKCLRIIFCSLNLLVSLFFFKCVQDNLKSHALSSRALEHYEQGVKYYYFADYHSAISSFNKAAAITPDSKIVYCRLSMTYFKTENLKQANQYRNLAISNLQNENLKDKIFIQWWDARFSGQDVQANQLLNRLIMEHEYNTEFLHLKAEGLVSQKKYATAIEIWHQVLKLDDNYLPALLGLGVVRLTQKEFDPAEKWFEKALELYPNQAITHTRLGELYYYRGRYELAEQELFSSIDLLQRAPKAHFLLALALKENGSIRPALDNLQEISEAAILDSIRLSQLYAIQAGLYFSKNLDRQAENKCRQALKCNTKNAKAYFWLGMIFSRKNRFDDAFVQANQIKTLREISTCNSQAGQADYHRLLSEIYFTKNDIEPALNEAKIATDLAGANNSLDYLRHLSRIYFQVEDYVPAMTICESILQQNPNYPPAHFLLAQILEKQNNRELACVHYQHFLTLMVNADPGTQSIQKSKTRLAILNQNFKPKKLLKYAQEPE